jgi:acyl carrier protein
MKNTLTTEEIHKVVKKKMAQLGYPSTQATLNASFLYDLGFDSLDIVEFMMEMEQSFDIEIPVDIMEQRCQTVGGLVELVEELQTQAPTMSR